MYDGGYYSLDTRLIKSGMNGHTAALADPVSDAVLSAINAVQRTPWRINRRVLAVLRALAAEGAALAGLPGADPEPLPADIPDSEWSRMSPAERGQHKQRRAIVHGRNARAVGKREELARKVAAAEAMAGYERFWFPHALDFRGRLYPLPQDLHPQGDGLTKALLQFADGKPLFDSGLRWLMVALANAAGQDKLGLDERVQWVHDNRAAILDSADDPLDGRRFWCSPAIDDPWGFLALAFEYADARRHPGGPAQYVCHQPVQVDATCSGMQHLSAMGLDAVGGKATNLTDSGRREDLYSEVAEEVKRLVARDAAAGDARALNWLGHITRATVKRAVMTKPYGVTSQGIRDQLIADGHCDAVAGNPSVNADYLRDKIEEALAGTVAAAEQIMSWLQGVARALADANIPFDWVTPVGLKVRQAYWAPVLTRVKTLYGQLSLWQEAQNVALDTKKMALSAAPNFVHSFDAAHLVLTVNAAVAEGIVDFSLIHDSYGTHAADMDALNRILRATFVSMYEADWLERTEQYVRSYAPEVELPPRPLRGPLDLSGVLRSAFFFS